MAAARSGFGVWRVGIRALGECAAEGGGKQRTAAPAVTTLHRVRRHRRRLRAAAVTTTPEQFTSTAPIGVAPPAHHGLNLIAPPSPVITAAVKPAPLPTPERVPDVVVIKYGPGGLVDEYKQRYADYRLTKTKVELRGPCYSACTLSSPMWRRKTFASQKARSWRFTPSDCWSAACGWIVTHGWPTPSMPPEIR